MNTIILFVGVLLFGLGIMQGDTEHILLGVTLVVCAAFVLSGESQ